MNFRIGIRAVLVISTIGLSLGLEAQTPSTPPWAAASVEQKEERLQWWQHDRFGMFIHWGIYALPARHEWVKKRERISDEDYQKYFDHFDPDLYDPREWARKAKAAGMKYVVLTTKHHDGFCLWNTKYSDFKVTNTPYGRDLLRPFVKAMRAEGLRIGFYYSLIDWHHPDFPYDYMHPNKPDTLSEQVMNRHRDICKYQQYMKNQIRELLTDYGPIDILFLDFSYPSYPNARGKGHEEWDSEGLVRLIRQLQPQILINNRLDLNDKEWGWDFITPEQYVPQEWPRINGRRVAWETCQTLSGSWGYYRDEYSWKSVHQLLTLLIESVSKGGNMLLNVGPTARGLFDERADERLDAIARWMKLHSRAIYGCTEAPKEFSIPKNSLLTYDPTNRRLYIHLLEWPSKSLYLRGYKGKFKYAQLLNDGSEITFNTQEVSASHTKEPIGEQDVILNLPVLVPNTEIPVIELLLN